jgi:hypothetical protein
MKALASLPPPQSSIGGGASRWSTSQSRHRRQRSSSILASKKKDRAAVPPVPHADTPLLTVDTAPDGSEDTPFSPGAPDRRLFSGWLYHASP